MKRLSQEELFRAALGLEEPWTVGKVEFSVDEQRLDIWLAYGEGAQFACPYGDAVQLQPYDAREHTWRHLNFFQFHTYLHARVPRVRCPEHGVHQVETTWARPGSGFTLLFEALVMLLAKAMPMRDLSRLVGEHDTRLWRVVKHYVEEARAKADFSEVQTLAVDETSSQRGHNYITLVAEPEKARILFATVGRDSATIARFREDFEQHGGQADAVKEIALDMSAAFIKGMSETFSQAALVFDRFHATKLLTDAVDEVRRAEQRVQPILKNSRYLWLRNAEDLRTDQITDLSELRSLHLKTARAYNLKMAFQDFYDQPQDAAEAYLLRWYNWAIRSQLPPIIRAAKTIRKHWHGVLGYHRSRVTNGMLEAFNGLIQSAKRRARGYRNPQTLILMAYLIAGKLSFNLPNPV